MGNLGNWLAPVTVLDRKHTTPGYGPGEDDKRRKQIESGDWHESQMDEYGYLDFIPDPDDALNVQQRAERLAERRNQGIVDRALGFQREGLSNLQTYRPGGASAMASGAYANLSNIELQKQTDAPDLLADWREKKQRDAEKRADKQANKATIGSVLMPIGQGGSALGQQAAATEAGATQRGGELVKSATGSATPATAGSPAAAGQAPGQAGTGGPGQPPTLPANAGGQAPGAPGGGSQGGPGGGGTEAAGLKGGGGAGGLPSGQAGVGAGGAGSAAGSAGAGAGVSGGGVGGGSGQLMANAPIDAAGAGAGGATGGGGVLGGPIGAILGAVLAAGTRTVEDTYGALAYTAEGAADDYGAQSGQSSSQAANEVAGATSVGAVSFVDYSHASIDGHLQSVRDLSDELRTYG